MQSPRLFLSFFAGFFFVLHASAQDLLRKVPEDATYLITINNKAVFKHLDINDLNITLSRLGWFDTMAKEKDISLGKLQDLGIDLESRAYLFGQTNDSVQFFGALIPLADRPLFEAFITAGEQVETVNGLKTIYSADRTTRTSWDEHTIYVMNGTPRSWFFDQPHIKERYSLPDSPYDSYYGQDYGDYTITDAEAIPEWYYEDLDSLLVDTTYVDTVEWDDDNAYDSIIPPPVARSVEDDDPYAAIDSVLSTEEYSDDYYTQYQIYSQQKDSLINIVVHDLLNAHLEKIIQGQVRPYDLRKGTAKLNDNTIVDVKIRNLYSLYSAYYPMDILYSGFGLGTVPRMDFGIEEITGQLVVEGHKLVFTGDALLDNEMARYYKEIYNKKINSKFLPFLDQEALGFMSFNINTEAYLKHLPTIVEKYYGEWLGKYAGTLSLGTTFFDILVDEKAVAKVFKGDNLLILNGVTQVEEKYTDYEYDEEYNSTPVEKTRIETQPQFLWMFSSDDTRIFQKILDLGISENGVELLDGVYAVRKNERDPFMFYVVIKDGIVFIGNERSKLQDIKDSRYHGKGYAPYVNMAKKNSYSLVFNTKQLPDLIDQLDLPVPSSMEQKINELSQYGDFYIVSNGVKGNRLKGELGIEFPKKGANALSFLFSILDSWLIDLR